MVEVTWAQGGNAMTPLGSGGVLFVGEVCCCCRYCCSEIATLPPAESPEMSMFCGATPHESTCSEKVSSSDSAPGKQLE